MCLRAVAEMAVFSGGSVFVAEPDVDRVVMVAGVACALDTVHIDGGSDAVDVK